MSSCNYVKSWEFVILKDRPALAVCLPLPVQRISGSQYGVLSRDIELIQKDPESKKIDEKLKILVN